MAEVSGFRSHGGQVRSELTNINFAKTKLRSPVTNNCGQISQTKPCGLWSSYLNLAATLVMWSRRPRIPESIRP